MKAQKKKILFVEYFSFIGGGQVVLLNLLKNLKQDYDIKVLLLNEGKLVKELKNIGVNYYIIKAPLKIKYRYFWNILPVSFKIYKFLKKIKPDLIYANCFFAVKLLAPIIKLLKIKTIWHKHIIIDKKYNSYLSRQIRKYSKFVNVIICVSHAVKESLINTGVNKDKLKVIYNGIEIPEINIKKERKKIREKYKIRNEFLIGSIGFFRENKGFDIFIKCAYELKKKLKNLKFILAGKSDLDSNSYEIKLKNLIKDLKLNNDFILPGYVDRYKILPAFDLFVLPSYAEPFGLITLETLSLGIPVVAFATGGSKEIIKNGYNGFLVNKVGYEFLTEKVLYILKNRKYLRKISKNARKYTRDKFGIKKQIVEIKKIISKLTR